MYYVVWLCYTKFFPCLNLLLIRRCSSFVRVLFDIGIVLFPLCYTVTQVHPIYMTGSSAAVSAINFLCEQFRSLRSVGLNPGISSSASSSFQTVREQSIGGLAFLVAAEGGGGGQTVDIAAGYYLGKESLEIFLKWTNFPYLSLSPERALTSSFVPRQRQFSKKA